MSSRWVRRGVAVFTSLAALVFAVSPAPDSAFSIAATTDAIVVEPGCQDQVRWDLPPGWVVAEGAPLDAVDPLASPAAPVTVELAAGARATVIREAAGYWKMRFTQDAPRRCDSAPSRALAVAVGGEEIPSDPGGYFYQSSYGEDPSRTAASAVSAERPLVGPAPPLTLRLAGRIILGQPMSEGGGWGGASQPILHGARIEVRDRAWLTNQSLSVLVEEVGSGSLVDTHACIDAEARHETEQCGLDEPSRSAGFLYYGGDDGAMRAQVHRSAGKIGVVPYGGDERSLSVTNWAILVKSPALQLIVAALLLISALLQGWASFRDLFPQLTKHRPSARQDERDRSTAE